MSKYVVLSFDDGRSDTYTEACQILLRYGFTGTINIVTDYVSGKSGNMYSSFKGHKAMTKENVIDLYGKGFEIACHGNTHKNDPSDIRDNIRVLREWGVIHDNPGFASPYSYITKKNGNSIFEMVNRNELSYIRSGLQIKREGFLISAAFFLQEKIKSKRLFYRLNKKLCCSMSEKTNFILGISITNKTTFEQVEYLINKMPDESCAILIFHSLSSDKSVYSSDRWCWGIDRFIKLCDFLKMKNIKTLRNIDLISYRG